MTAEQEVDLELSPADPLDLTVLKMLAMFAHCPWQPTMEVVKIDTEMLGDGMSKASFINYGAKFSKEIVAKDGKTKRVNPAQLWLIDPRRINIRGQQMRPDMPRPLFDDVGELYGNTFAKPQHSASPEGQDVFTAFMEHLLPDPAERDYCLDALAHKLAHPEVPGPGLLMVSPRQGAGRGTLFTILQQLYGPRYVRKIDPGALTGDGEGQGKYNTWLESSIVALVDELLNPGDGNVFWRRKRAYDRIKSLIDPATREVEIIRKGINNGPARTFTTFIMATNNANALPLDEDDRRICVLTNGGKLADNAELAEKLNRYRRGGAFTDGFIAGAACVLEARPLDKFDAYAPPPLFAGKVNMIARNLTEVAEAADAVLLEMDEQLFQQRVGEAILIGEIHIAEHAAQPDVGVFDGVQRIVQPLTDLGRLLAYGVPAVFFGNVETMLIGVGGFLAVAGLNQKRLELLVPYIAKALIEQQAEDVLLVVGGIDGASQDIRCAPEVPLKLGLRQFGHYSLTRTCACQRSDYWEMPTNLANGQSNCCHSVVVPAGG